MLLQALTGAQRSGDGAQPIARVGNLGDLIVSGLHGRFYEQTLRGQLFTFGLTETVLHANNAIATNVDQNARPIIGLWNPPYAHANLVILSANIIVGAIGNNAVAPGGFMWVYAVNQSLISTGSTPLSLKPGSVTDMSLAKAFAVSTPLTGLVGNVAVLRPAAITPIVNCAGTAEATAIHRIQGSCCDAAEGSLIVPPGGVLAIMNQVSTVTISTGVSILWEEVPLP